MKKSGEFLLILSPVILTLGLYLGFYSEIALKPGNAGFWLILALGMSLGVALTRFIQLSKTGKNEKK